MHPDLVLEQISFSLDIEKLKKGNIVTFHLCYNSFYAKLYTVAAGSLSNKTKAATIVQLAFVKCWLKRNELTSFDYLNAFLHITVKNTCKAFNNVRAEQFEVTGRILNRFLSADIRYGRSRKELYAHLQLLSPDMLQSATELFDSLLAKRKTIVEIGEAYNMPADSVQFKIDLACQMLHLIISSEPIQ